MMNYRRALLSAILYLIATTGYAQLSAVGANRSDVAWHQFDTDHFTIVYHDGLRQSALDAADVAEAIYPVVTGNLGKEIAGRTLLYLSDLDDVPNAFAQGDSHIFLWMRGILDDMPLGGIRSAGRAKWFRAVITHEFTHITIAHATKDWTDAFAPVDAGGVPRWFNEGSARFMEPDGWTTDVDQVLRVAAVNGRLGFGGMGALDGTLLYETGHSLVRYLTHRFGPQTLAKIVNGGRSFLGLYDFDAAVIEATGQSMSQIHADWLRTVNVLYGTNYGVREETDDIVSPLVKGFEAVPGIRFAPDGKRIALFGRTPGLPTKLYLMDYDTSATHPRVLSDEPGLDPEFSWSPDGARIVVSKSRYGSHTALTHDLYIMSVPDGNIERLTTDAALSDPAWSPDGAMILAVEKRVGRDQLVMVDPESGEIRRITSFNDDVQLYKPTWSPDGARIAFSIFEANGHRSIATMARDGSDLRILTNDSLNNRYPIYSPDGKRIAFTSTPSGIPNLMMMNADGSDAHSLTDVAGGLYGVQWVPGHDSILVTSFDTRDRIAPHLISSDRRVTPVAMPRIAEKYSAWQRVSLPQRVHSQSEIQRATTSLEEGYVSAAHIGMIASFPFYATDRSSTGSRGGRLVALSIWQDPMGKHQFVGAADYGIKSHEPGISILYRNATLPITIDIAGGSSFGYRGDVQDIPYYQRNSGAKLSASYTLLAPNSLTLWHDISIDAAWHRYRPFNVTEFPGDEHSPIAADIAEVGLGYQFQSRKLTAGIEFRRAEPAIGSDLRYNRFSGGISWRQPIAEGSSIALLTNLEGAAQWGDQLPQEFLGLDRNDQFDGGFNVTSEIAEFRPNYRVRGVRRYVYGDRVAVGSIGLIQPFGSLGPAPMQLLIFAEAGSAWYADTTKLFSIPITAGYGVELRIPIIDRITLGGGIAFEMIEKPRREFYVRVSGM